MSAEKELLRPIELHELEEKGKFKKHVWKLVSVLMIVLVLSYMLTGFTVMSIIAGFFDSAKIEGSTLNGEYGEIIFNSNTNKILSTLYNENEKEFRACVIGDYVEGKYVLDKVVLPTIHFQDYDQVVSSPCPKETLLDMHSHPQQHCIFSEVDINGFNPGNENTLLTVMCGDGRFIFHK